MPKRVTARTAAIRATPRNGGAATAPDGSLSVIRYPLTGEVNGAKAPGSDHTNNEERGTSNAALRPSNAQPVTSNDSIKRSGLVRAGDRPAELVSFDDAVVSFFVDAADMLGVPKSVAAIYGVCFASPRPLSFSEIDDRLDISSGSISQGLRVLKEVGALKVADATEKLTRGTERNATSAKVDTLTSESGSTEDEAGGAGAGTASTSAPQLVGMSASQRAAARYEPDLELRKLVLHWIEKRLQAQLTTGRTRLQQIVESIPADSATREALLTRFESLQTWQDKGHSLLPIAKTFLKI